VKLLLRFVTILMITMTLLMPLLECFDRWDSPGLGNDTEFPLFLITLFISLVLLAAVAFASRTMARQNAQIETEVVYEIVRSAMSPWTDVAVSPLTCISPPLRI
jgi:hypothetical protein